MARLRTPPPSIHGELQRVHDGDAWVGTVVKIGSAWRGLGRGGLDLGLFDAAIEARRAVLQRHRAAMMPA